VSPGVVRVGDTVRRPIGPHTAAVHALLSYLHAAGFAGAPRPLGIDEQGREVLSFIPGTVPWPDRFDLLEPGASDDRSPLGRTAATLMARRALGPLVPLRLCVTRRLPRG
jgi:hypothetical protein